MYSDTIFLLNINGGQVVGLVGKVLTLQVQGKAFKPQNPYNKSQVWLCVCNPSVGGTQEDPWGLLASQTSLLNERLCFKTEYE